MLINVRGQENLYIPEEIAGRIAFWQSLTTSEIGGIGAISRIKSGHLVQHLWFEATSISAGGHDLTTNDFLSAFQRRMADVDDPNMINTIWHTHPFGHGASFSPTDEGTIREFTEGGRGYYFLLFSNDFGNATAKHVKRINGLDSTTLLKVIYRIKKVTKEGMDAIREARRSRTVYPARSHQPATLPTRRHGDRSGTPGVRGGTDELAGWFWEDGEWYPPRRADPDVGVSDAERTRLYIGLLRNQYGFDEREAAELVAAMGEAELLADLLACDSFV